MVSDEIQKVEQRGYSNGDIEDHDTGDDVDCDHWIACESDDLFED